LKLITRAVVFAGLAVALLVGAVGASALNTALWHVSFSVASTTSLVNNTADFSFGVIVPGNSSAQTPDSLTITSNDPSGVQLTASTQTGVVESGASPCVPQANRNLGTQTPVFVSPSATTGGTSGVAGTPAGQVNLTSAAQNLFTAVPTNTGTLTEVVQASVLPDLTTPPNSNGCSYTLPILYTLIAQ
jgi:hypothetical protein